MAREVKFGIRLTGDAKGAVNAMQLTDKELSRLQREMKRADGTMAKSRRTLKGWSSGILSAKSAIGGLMGAVGVGALANFAQQSIASTAAISELADRAGISSERMQELTKSFSDLGGVSESVTTGALRRFNRRMGLAAEGTGAAKDTFGELGISIRDAGGRMRETQPVLDEAIKRLSRIENDSVRAAQASELFGEDAGPAMAAALGQGADAIDEHTQKLREQGRVLSNETVQAARDANDELNEMRDIVSAEFARNIADNAEAITALGGAMAKLAGWASDAAGGFVRFAEGLGEGMAKIIHGSDELEDRLVERRKRIMDVMNDPTPISGWLLSDADEQFIEQAGGIEQALGRVDEALAQVRQEAERADSQMRAFAGLPAEPLAAIASGTGELADEAGKAGEEVARLMASYTELGETAGMTKAEMAAYKLEQAGATEEQIKAAVASIKHAKALEEQAERTRSAREESAKFKSELEALKDQLDPFRKEAREMFDALEMIEDAYGEGSKEAEKWSQKILMTMGGAEEATRDLADTTETETQRMESALSSGAEAAQEAWENSLRRIDDAFADVWRGAFDSFSDFADSLKNAFQQLLAELAHAAITRPIMLSLGASMGVIPQGASAASSAISGAGALSSGGGLLDMVTGGVSGMGSAITGIGGALGSSMISGVGTGMGLTAANFAAGGLTGGLSSTMGLVGSSLSSGAVGTAFGAALPVVGPLLGIAGALGAFDGLFGGKPSHKRQRTDIDLMAEQITRTGQGSSTVTGGYDAFSQAVQGSGDKYSQEGRDAADALGQAITSMATSLTDTFGGEIDKRLSVSLSQREGLELADLSAGEEYFSGKEFKQASDLLRAAIGKLLDGATADVPAYISTLLGSLTGDVEAIVRQFDAVTGISRMIGRNVVGEASAAYDDAQNPATTAQAFRDQTDSVRDLASALDGSEQSLIALNYSYARQQQLAYQLTQTYLQAGDAVESSLMSLRERIRQDLMGEEELYNYRKSQAESLAASLRQMTDPARITETIGRIEDLTGSAWQSLAEGQRQAMGEEFLSFLDDTNSLAQKQLDKGLAQVEDAQANLSKEVERAMQNAASAMNSAADKQNAAADKMTSAADRISAAVSRMPTGGGAEVTYA